MLFYTFWSCDPFSNRPSPLNSICKPNMRSRQANNRETRTTAREIKSCLGTKYFRENFNTLPPSHNRPTRASCPHHTNATATAQPSLTPRSLPPLSREGKPRYLRDRAPGAAPISPLQRTQD